MKTLGKLSILGIFTLILGACTGGKLSAPEGAGGILILPGQKITVEMKDLVTDLAVNDYTLTLRSISPDFRTTQILYDLTDYAVSQLAKGSTRFELTLPKGLQSTRPLMLYAEVPALGTLFMDAVYGGELRFQPGIPSTLAFRLIQSYPGKSADSYTDSDFRGISSLIRARTETMLAESEHLSLSATPFRKVWRYFVNGLAYNIDFLTRISQYQLVYTWDTTTPPGLVADQTPEHSLDSYRYATQLKVNGELLLHTPFEDNYVNYPAMIGGWTGGRPGQNTIMEGEKIQLKMTGADLDSDFLDKDLYVEYIPRVLPKSRTDRAEFVPEPTPSRDYRSYLLGPTEQDSYTTTAISYNEALDLNAFKPEDPAQTVDASKYPGMTKVDTAHRRVYYLLSDGSVRVPVYWDYSYGDTNRAPMIIRDADGNLNNTSLDSTLIPAGELATQDKLDPSIRWYTHGSHCESTASRLDVNDTYYQAIQRRRDGPWACVFMVYDPDSDEDPNGSADRFYYSVELPKKVDGTENMTAMDVNGGRVWPIYLSPAPHTALWREGDVIPSCVDGEGNPHRNCGRASVLVQIDNSVANSVASQASQTFTYTAKIKDRADNGLEKATDISRDVVWVPHPPRFLNLSSTTPPGDPATARCAGEAWNEAKGNDPNFYECQDIYLSQILSSADPNSTPSVPGLSKIALAASTESGLQSTLTDSANRNRMFLQNSIDRALSPYFNRPFTPLGGVVEINWSDPMKPFPKTSGFSPKGFTALGNSLKPDTTTSDLKTKFASNYSSPREFDGTCGAANPTVALENNRDVDSATPDRWDQSSGGFVFEVDAFDSDNAFLNLQEDYDTVALKNFSHDVAKIDNVASLEYCQYKRPNVGDLIRPTYEKVTLTTGTATSTIAAVDPDFCTWIAAPASIPEMQPIPVLYQVNDGGTPTIKKMVYHRSRFRWKPRESATAPNLEMIQNKILAGIQICGPKCMNPSTNVSARDKSLDQSTLSSDLPLFATRRDMKPCIDAGSAQNAWLTQDSTTDGVEATWAVMDENRGKLPGGRTSIELSVVGGKSILDKKFLRWSLFAENRITSDHLTRPGQVRPGPAIWYSEGSDLTPKLRLDSALNPARKLTPLPSGPWDGPIKMRFYRTPVTPSAGVVYDEAVVINSPGTNTTPFKIDFTAAPYSILGSCLSVSSVILYPGQTHFVIPSHCGVSSGRTSGSQIWGSGTDALGTTAVSAYVLNPNSLENGGLPAGTAMSLDRLPFFYGATDPMDIPTSSAAAMMANTLFFEIHPIETFKLLTLAGQTYKTPQYYGDLMEDGTTPKWMATSELLVSSVRSRDYAAGSAPLQDWSVSYVDFDNLQKSIFAPSPTPTPSVASYTYLSSGNTVSVYLKNAGNITAQIPFLVRDVADASVPDADPFDITTYTIAPPTAASPAPYPSSSAPTLGRNGNLNCQDSPAGYPSNYAVTAAKDAAGTLSSVLNATALLPYKGCTLTWKPASTDQGEARDYLVYAQDNYGATSSTFGAGAIYPNTISSRFGLSSPYTTNANAPVPQPSPYPSFILHLQAIETNLAPYPKTSGGSLITNLYNPAGGGTGWSAVFGSNNGKKPASCSLSSIPTQAKSLYSCPLAATDPDIGTTLNSDGTTAEDFLYNTSPIWISEGSVMPSQVVYAGDDNKTTELKTLVFPSSISKVYVVDTGAAYKLQVPITTSTPSSNQIKLDWDGAKVSTSNTLGSELDLMALSGTGGFLIPVTVSDQMYKPPGLTTIPESDPLSYFWVKPLKTTIWVWAKMRVVNNAPKITYSDPNGTIPANGGGSAFSNPILDFSTGKTTTYKIRVRDPDWAARSYFGFSPAIPATGNFTQLINGAGNPIAVTFGPSASQPTPVCEKTSSASSTCNNLAYYQDFDLSITPGSADTGFYTSPKLSFSDPGDFALGLPSGSVLNGTTDPYYAAVDPSAPTVPWVKAMIQSGSSLPFKIRIVGKPSFLVPGPNAGGLSAPVYTDTTNRSFTYPLSLKITRDAEKGQAFFVGLSTTDRNAMIASLTTRMQPGDAAPDVFVNDKSVFNWLNLPLQSGVAISPVFYGVARAKCGVKATGDTTIQITLTRKTSAGVLENCDLYKTAFDQDLAVSSALALNTENTLISAIPLSTFVQKEAWREANLAPSSNEAADLFVSQNFGDFKGRVRGGWDSGTNSPSSCAVSGLSLLDLSYRTQGSIEYVSSLGGNSLKAKYHYSYSGGSGSYAVKARKIYRYVSNNPSDPSSSAIEFTANKGELPSLRALLQKPATGAKPHIYRWYVNGCLKMSGRIDQLDAPFADENGITQTSWNSVHFEQMLDTFSSGRNTDCTGSYSFQEAGASQLGVLYVRLVMGKGNESLNGSNYEGGSTYLWKINVINTDASVLTENTATTPAIQKPLSLSSPGAAATSPYLAKNSSTLLSALSVQGQDAAGKQVSYFAFADLNLNAASSIDPAFPKNGLYLRLIPLTPDGNLTLNPATDAGQMLCSGYTWASSSPTYFGIQQKANSLNWTFAIGSPLLSSTAPAWGLNSTDPARLCYSNNLQAGVASATPTPSAVASVNTDPAGYLFYSKYSLSTDVSNHFGVFGASSTLFDHSASGGSSYYLMKYDVRTSTNSFWNNGFTGDKIYNETPRPPYQFFGPTPTPAASTWSPTAGNVTDRIRKTIPVPVSSGVPNQAIQLLGEAPSSAGNTAVGRILVSTLVPGTSASGTFKTLKGSITKTVVFKDSGANPVVTAPQPAGDAICPFQGSPLDGVYVPALDTLFALVYNPVSGSQGMIVAVSKLVNGTPSCSLIGNVPNPSVSLSTFNTQVPKMVYDPARGMIYGLTLSSTNRALYTIDIYANSSAYRDLSFTPHALLFAPDVNALYLMDGSKGASSGLNSKTNGATLYRVW